MLAAVFCLKQIPLNKHFQYLKPPVYLCVTSSTIHPSLLAFPWKIPLSLSFHLHIDLALTEGIGNLCSFFLSERWKGSTCDAGKWKRRAGVFCLRVVSSYKTRCAFKNWTAPSKWNKGNLRWRENQFWKRLYLLRKYLLTLNVWMFPLRSLELNQTSSVWSPQVFCEFSHWDLNGGSL